MKKYILYCVLFVCNFAVAKSWLGFGDMRGHIEPCGCDIDNDYGGVLRLESLINSIRKKHKVTVFNLGNNLELFAGVKSKKEFKHTKSGFILQSIKKINPDVSLLNVLEAESINSLVGSYFSKNSYYVSSNYNHSYPKWLKKWVVKNGYLVFGYTYLKNWNIDKKFKKIDLTMVKKWKLIVSENKNLEPVLMFSGSISDLQYIIDAKIFKTIISSNPAPKQSIISSDFKDKPESLRKIINSQIVRIVPIGAQAVLRGGELIFSKDNSDSMFCNPLFTSANNPNNCKSRSLNMFDDKNLQFYTLLDKNIKSSGNLDVIFKEYSNLNKLKFRENALLKLKNQSKIKFAGAKKCKNCHVKETTVYLNSRHSKAMNTLVVKNKNEDEACVSCHVVGFNKAGGYIDIKHTPFLKNVQCENCHGSALKHLENPTNKLSFNSNPKGSCKSCHVPEHSAKFDFKVYWNKIKH